MNKTKVAGELLSVAVDSFERTYRDDKPLNQMALMATGEAAKLLQFDHLGSRLEPLLNQVTLGGTLSGSITNISLSPTETSEKMLTRAQSELEMDYPMFKDTYVQELLNKEGKHVAACNDDNFERAFSLAHSEYDKAQVPLVYALLGNFEVAEVAMKRFPTRIHEINTVICIELYRRDQVDAAKEIQTELLSEDSVWTPVHLSLGIAGRVPWFGYPFPDF